MSTGLPTSTTDFSRLSTAIAHSGTPWAAERTFSRPQSDDDGEWQDSPPSQDAPWSPPSRAPRSTGPRGKPSVIARARQAVAQVFGQERPPPARRAPAKPRARRSSNQTDVDVPMPQQSQPPPGRPIKRMRTKALLFSDDPHMPPVDIHCDTQKFPHEAAKDILAAASAGPMICWSTREGPQSRVMFARGDAGADSKENESVRKVCGLAVRGPALMFEWEDEQ